MTDVETLNAILRAKLISQGEVDPQLVRDATTEYGSYLDQNTHDDVFESIERASSEKLVASNKLKISNYITVKNTVSATILFELRPRESEINVNYTNEDGIISYYRTYTVYVMIYGDDSANVANKIVGRFMTERIRNSFLSYGVYLEKISNPSQVNEFKNNRLWHRNDIEIDITCEVEIDQLEQDEDYESYELKVMQRR